MLVHRNRILIYVLTNTMETTQLRKIVKEKILLASRALVKEGIFVELNHSIINIGILYFNLMKKTVNSKTIYYY